MVLSLCIYVILLSGRYYIYMRNCAEVYLSPRIGGHKKEPDLIALTCVGLLCIFLLFFYATLLFASSTSVAKPSASFTAMSASTFLFSSTPASFSPYMKRL